MRRLALLLLALLAAALPRPAVADTAQDLADLVACLAGGGVEARIAARVAADGGATGTLSATFSGVDGAALERLIERGNAGLAKQADRLSAKGVTIGRLALGGAGAQRVVRTTAAVVSLADVPAAFSPNDPVEFTATCMNKFLVVRAAPRPALLLLAPFVKGLTVEVSLPGDPGAHNAGQVDGRTLRWGAVNSFPTVEFTVGVDR